MRLLRRLVKAKAPKMTASLKILIAPQPQLRLPFPLSSNPAEKK